MKHWHKVILLIFCVSTLFYFDSKEKPNVRNNNKFHVDSDIRVRFGHISVRSVCSVAVKRGRRQVKCPVCDKWVKTLETRERQDKSTYRRYECANEHRFVTKEKVERILVVSHDKRKKV